MRHTAAHQIIIMIKNKFLVTNTKACVDYAPVRLASPWNTISVCELCSTPTSHMEEPGIQRVSLGRCTGFVSQDPAMLVFLHLSPTTNTLSCGIRMAAFPSIFFYLHFWRYYIQSLTYIIVPFSIEKCTTKVITWKIASQEIVCTIRYCFVNTHVTITTGTATTGC